MITMSSTTSPTSEIAESQIFLGGSALPPYPAVPSALSYSHALHTESEWLELRERALPPLHASELVTTERDRIEFVIGATLLRMTGETALHGNQVQPQQVVICDALAAGHKRNAISVPRRSSKSTSVIAIALGRAACRPDYRVGILTLTTGKAGRSRFLKDVAAHIERLYPDAKTRPLKLSRMAGMEGVSFPDGGSVTWLSTVNDVRGEAFDMLVLDEAGEPNDPAFVKEVISAALPTLDTRPGAQLLVMGTAGRWREGNALWDALALGRKGFGGIVEYAMPDTTTDEELAAWEPTDDYPEAAVGELILAAHPGIGTLTTVESIRENYEAMGDEDFAREYGGIFGTIGSSSSIFNLENWAAGGSGAALPTPPERFAIAMVAHPDSLFSCLVAVWRDEEGRAVPLLLEHKRGVDWLPLAANRLSKKHNVPLVYDTGSQVIALTVEALNRARPRPKLMPMQFREIKSAASLVVDEVERGNVIHYRQPEVDQAIKLAVKRKAGTNGWALGRNPKNPADDILAAEAFSIGLLAFDNLPKKVIRRKPMVQAA